MSITIAFDVYGTLINTHGVVSKLQEIVVDQTQNFSQTWRDKQLEYSFRRGLMKEYETFAVCTAQALDYTCAYYKLDLTKEQIADLLASYRTLPAFDDVKEGLVRLKEKGCHLYAFSNGQAEAVETLLVTAGIRERFLGVVSVDGLKTFKPNPDVYEHFLRESDASAESAWLVSSNPFDVIGALACGMNAAWVKRSESAIFDPWGFKPTITVENLAVLADQIG